MSDTKSALSKSVSRRSFLATSAIAGASVAGSGALLAACGGGSGSPTPQGSGGGSGAGLSGSLTWGSWANPGEAERFRQYTADFMKRNPDTKVTFQVVTGDYASKMLTQLSGGTAPDAFYVGDTLIAKAIENKVLVELGQYPEIKAAYDATYKGLRDWAKSADGGIYGIDVDCNPNLLWFNKKILDAAGVTQDPAAAFEAGAWNQAAITDLLTKVKATGKRGVTMENGSGDLFSWITTFGGKTFDDSGKAIFDTDEKAQAALTWLPQQVANGNITYAGALPKGQGAEALFYAGQMAMVPKGRWILPNLKKLKSTVTYDIAPFPSEDGKTVAPVAVYTACMSVNAKAKDPNLAKGFLTDFVGMSGQKFRLSGGGNAVPTVVGLEDIVTEGNDPPHGATFANVAKEGYAVPTVFVTDSKKNADFPLKNDLLMKDIQNQTAKTYATELCNLLNA